jgi:hypothetical protein
MGAHAAAQEVRKKDAACKREKQPLKLIREPGSRRWKQNRRYQRGRVSDPAPWKKGYQLLSDFLLPR